MAFEASIKRRKLTAVDVKVIQKERLRVNKLYREWLKTLTPDDIQRMELISDVVAIFEEGRSMGYRMPHK